MTYLRFARDNAPFLSAGFLLAFTSSYGQTVFIALFAGEIMAAFGLSDGTWGLVYTVATTASAVAMIQAGALADRIRIRTLGLFVTGGLVLACLGMAAVQGAITLALAIFALRFLGQGMISHLANLAMARWFVASRGKALSISSMGFAIGQAMLPLLFVWALAFTDWRVLWVVAAGMVVVVMPIVRRLLRAERTPQSIAQDTETAGMDGRHWTRTDLLHHWLFWALVPLLIGPPAFGTALLFHQVHFAAQKGWALLDFVSLLPLLTVATVSATFAAGAALDRFGASRLLALYLLPFAAAFVVLSQVETLAGAAFGLVLFGLGSGMQATVPTAFWAEIYGTRHLGAIKAMATAIMVFGTAVGPGLTGAIIDAGVDFPQQMPVIAVYFLFAAALAALAVARSSRLNVPA